MIGMCPQLRYRLLDVTDSNRRDSDILDSNMAV